MSARLYRAAWISEDEVADEEGIYPSDYYEQAPLPDPDGWAEFCEAKWGEYKPFFFPSVDRIYRSRSAAQRRVDIINHWGGKAEVLECTPSWQPLEAAKRDREHRRIRERIARLETMLDSELTKLAEVSS